LAFTLLAVAVPVVRRGAHTLVTLINSPSVVSPNTLGSRPANIDFGPSPGSGVNEARAVVGVS